MWRDAGWRAVRACDGFVWGASECGASGGGASHGNLVQYEQRGCRSHVVLFVNALGGVAWREVHVYLCAGASMPLVRVLRVVHVVLGVRPSR